MTRHDQGTLYGLGLGPGDPELMTFKTVRLLGEADIVAYPTAKAGAGVALGIVRAHLRPDQELVPLVYPVTAGPGADAPDYRDRISAFYDETAAQLARYLEQGRDVAIPCVGDPFFYGSFMYWYARLSPRFETVVVPGISSTLAGPVAAGIPLVFRRDVLTIIPGTLPGEEIARRLAGTDAAVIIKLGRTFAKVRRALEKAGVLARAVYVERASWKDERVLPAAEVDGDTVPYFSILFVASGEIG